MSNTSQTDIVTESTREPVANLSFLLERDFHPKEITNLLVNAITNLLGESYWVSGSISEIENELAQLLFDRKYSDTCWLLGI